LPLCSPIALVGYWHRCLLGFVLQQVMTGAKLSEENIAAASVATVEQVSIAVGAALAGLVGIPAASARAPIPAPFSKRRSGRPWQFVAVPLAASTIGVRLNLVARRSDQEPMIAANTARGDPEMCRTGRLRSRWRPAKGASRAVPIAKVGWLRSDVVRRFANAVDNREVAP
jgi:hypothetical protein